MLPLRSRLSASLARSVQPNLYRVQTSIGQEHVIASRPDRELVSADSVMLRSLFVHCRALQRTLESQPRRPTPTPPPGSGVRSTTAAGCPPERNRCARRSTPLRWFTAFLAPVDNGTRRHAASSVVTNIVSTCSERSEAPLRDPSLPGLKEANVGPELVRCSRLLQSRALGMLCATREPRCQPWTP